MRDVKSLLVLAGLLGACTAADGSWPSLLGPQATRSTVPAAVVPGQAVGAQAVDIPVIGAPTQAATQSGLMDVDVAPAATRLQQELRSVAFAVERLQSQQVSVEAAKAASGAAAAKALKSDTAKLGQIRIDLADSRDSARAAAAELAIAAAAGKDVRLPLQDAAQVLLRVAAARGEATPLASLAQIEAATSRAEAGFAAADKTWQAQAKTLRTLAPTKKLTPDDISWNQAQIDLTRINQTARSFATAQDQLASVAGDIALLATGAADTAPALQRAGRALAAIAARQAENEALVATTRQKLE